jgi:hypothetical protein
MVFEPTLAVSRFVWSRILDRLCMALERAWRLEPGTGNTNVAKRVDPEHLSCMGKLVG